MIYIAPVQIKQYVLILKWTRQKIIYLLTYYVHLNIVPKLFGAYFDIFLKALMRKIMCGDAKFGVLVFSSQYIHQKVTFSLWVHEICQIILSRTTASSDEKWIFCERRLTYYVSPVAAVVCCSL